MSTSPVPQTAVIVVAAGSGTRLGAGAPKAFVPLDAQPILRHALDGVFAAPVAQVIVVAPADLMGDARAIVDASAAASTASTTIVAGGATRQDSVAAGLAALAAEIEIVLVHDAARALTPPAVFTRVIDAVRHSGGGVVPALPVIDTLKQVDGPAVVAAVDRSILAAAQTPQGFPRALLDEAYANATEDFTDDAALFAAQGHPVMTVAGDALSFKVTTPADLTRARTLVTPSPMPVIPRVGVGTDVHAFGGEGTLWLASLEWPGEQALSGHSDGDAVAHAIVDALLAAAGLGDIGLHFGVDRPEFAGAHADAFLSATRDILHTAGWSIGNVSVQVQANRPRFAARRLEAEAALTAALGASVSLSATTTDGLGFTGRTEGVAAFAVALVVPR